jgi:hypothetical protein
MIKVKFLRERMGHTIGEVKDYEDNNSGLLRAWAADGYIEVVREKVEKLPVKEKVETKHIPKKLKK